jgi:Ran GTPase-activating protein (RanGAP) involved in mRNA processing and transport
LEYLGLEGKNQPLKLNHSFKPKEIRKQNRQVWPMFLHLAKHTEIELNMRKCFSSPKDMELVAYAIGLNPLSESKIRSIDLSKNTITKEGAKLLAPSLENNKFLLTLDLSHTKIGVSGMMHLAESLLKNNTLKHLNLYRNIIDVDGARSLGSLLKVNTSLEFIDVGHNRIRKTGLTAICDGILANPDSKLTQLGIRSNFINDDGFTYLFEKLVSGNKKQLTQLFIKQNFLSEYHKINLAKLLDDKGIVAYVDDFCTVDYLVKQKLDRTVWVSPMPKA